MQLKKYFYGLDVLRFIAALGVVNFHYFFGLAEGVTDRLSWERYGNLGVQLFFMISGFVISQSVATVSTKAFAVSRFIRLYPLFWVVCTFTYVFTLVMPNGNPVRFPEYLISMTMLGDKLSSALGYGGLVDPSYWTLAVELLFYAAIGAFVYFFSWKRIRLFLWGWLIISALSFYVKIDDSFIMKMLLVRHASYFILGATLALIITERASTMKQKVTDYALLSVTLVYSTLISFVALPPYFMPNKYDGVIIAAMHPILFGMVLFFIWLSRYLESSRARMVCGVIGGLTYPLYLLHQTIGRTILGLVGEGNKNALFVMVFMIGLSYVAYFYDKRLRKWLTLKLLPSKVVTQTVPSTYQIAP